MRDPNISDSCETNLRLDVQFPCTLQFGFLHKVRRVVCVSGGIIELAATASQGSSHTAAPEQQLLVSQ